MVNRIINLILSKIKDRRIYKEFRKEFNTFKEMCFEKNDNRFLIDWKDRNPQLNDRTPETGFSPQYIYHTAWAVQTLFSLRPKVHFDISSTLYFIVAASAICRIRFYDYRPAPIRYNNIETGKADLINLPFGSNTINSLSCMHVIEHVGLGRYGDPLNPAGDLIAMAELKRVLAPGGTLLFVVPISGEPRIQFNAHRIYSYRQIVNQFSDFKIEDFLLIPDDAYTHGPIKNASEALANAQKCAAGCFRFVK